MCSFSILLLRESYDGAITDEVRFCLQCYALHQFFLMPGLGGKQIRLFFKFRQP